MRRPTPPANAIPKQRLSDELLLEALKSGVRDHENRALAQMYKDYFPDVHAHITAQNASSDEARSIFEDGMAILFRQVVLRRFEAKTSIKEYQLGICKILWAHNGAQVKVSSDNQSLVPGHLVRFANAKDQTWLSNVWKLVSESCAQILKLSIFYQYSMREIAKEMEYKSQTVAKNKKYTCLEALKKVLEKQPEFKKQLQSLMKADNE